MTISDIASLGALTVSVIALLVAVRRPAVDQRHDGVRHAADELSVAVADVRELMWARRVVEPDPAEVARVMAEADRVCRRHEGRLPPRWGHLRLSVRSAAANYLGATAASAVDPRLGSLPLDPHEDHWWDVGTDYLDYVVRMLQRWRDEPEIGVALSPYDVWRRDEDDANRE